MVGTPHRSLRSLCVVLTINHPLRGCAAVIAAVIFNTDFHRFCVVVFNSDFHRFCVVVFNTDFHRVKPGLSLYCVRTCHICEKLCLLLPNRRVGIQPERLNAEEIARL